MSWYLIRMVFLFFLKEKKYWLLPLQVCKSRRWSSSSHKYRDRRRRQKVLRQPQSFHLVFFSDRTLWLLQRLDHNLIWFITSMFFFQETLEENGKKFRRKLSQDFRLLSGNGRKFPEMQAWNIFYRQRMSGRKVNAKCQHNFFVPENPHISARGSWHSCKFFCNISKGDMQARYQLLLPFSLHKGPKNVPQKIQNQLTVNFLKRQLKFFTQCYNFYIPKSEKNYYFVFVFCFSAQCVCLLPRCSEHEPACKWNKGNRKYTPLRPPFRKSYQ